MQRRTLVPALDDLTLPDCALERSPAMETVVSHGGRGAAPTHSPIPTRVELAAIKEGANIVYCDLI